MYACKADRTEGIGQHAEQLSEDIQPVSLWACHELPQKRAGPHAGLDI